MGLDGSTCSKSLPMEICRFEPPEHVPRTSARAHTFALVSGQAPCVPRSREHEENPRPDEKQMPKCQNNTSIQSKYLVCTIRARYAPHVFFYILLLVCSASYSSSNTRYVLPLYHKSGPLGLYATLTVSDLFFFVEFYGVF